MVHKDEKFKKEVWLEYNYSDRGIHCGSDHDHHKSI